MIDAPRAVARTLGERFVPMDAAQVLNQTRFDYPAHVRSLAGASNDPDDEIQRALRNKLDTIILDRSVLDDHPPFYWRATISTNRIDSYYTKMAPSSLQNYAREAETGVPFMNSHRTGGLFSGGAELPMGRSLFGAYHDGDDARVDADFYTLDGMQLTDIPTRALIDGIRGGLISDVSIGFAPGRFECSICSRDMLRDYECEHIPGFEYEVEPAGGGERSKILAYARVEDAHLSEVSGVYNGATPGAAVVKAYRLAEEGKLPERSARVIEMRYRVAVPGAQHVWSVTPNTKERGEMTPPKAGETDPAREAPPTPAAPAAPATPAPPASAGGDPRQPGIMSEAVRAALVKAGFNPPENDLAAHEAAVADLATRYRTATAEIETLKPQAADGVRYRAQLVSDTKAELARALGDKFNESAYGFLDSLPVPALERMRDDNAALAAQRFPGGRRTADSGDNSEGGGSAFTAPDEAYRA